MHIEICDITICYGRSVKTIGEQLYGKDNISEDERTKKAQNVYDSVLTAFPKLRQLMITAQKKAHDVGYVETILGRRRHIPDMQLDPYEFVAMPGYVNPDIDPLDPNTLKNKSDIPERIVKSLKKEFEGYKYYGQIVKRTKQLYEEGIKVINNTSKIADASRQCVNCVDFDTLILTPEGQKRYDEIKPGDKIYEFDTTSNTYIETKAQDVFIYDTKENGVHILGENIDAKCTLNHRWLIFDGLSDYMFITTEDLITHFFDDYFIAGFSSRIRDMDIKISYVELSGCWCVSTKSHNWIACRNSTQYITGNSIIQGSAAELTKMAILKLENDQRWKDIGGRLLIPVHDELICEVPMKYADQAGKLLSEIMSDAGSFLPFTISCDVTTTLRWYGLEYPCPYTEPKSLENMTEDEIKWVQYMLVESEYLLPVFPDENGEKARGNAAYGVNGKITDDMQNDIKDYMTKYNLKSDEEFLSHIKSKVLYG